MRSRKAVVSDSQIAGLAREAAQAGDTEMVKIAGKALLGNAAARRECHRVILAAQSIAQSNERQKKS